MLLSNLADQVSNGRVLWRNSLESLDTLPKIAQEDRRNAAKRRKPHKTAGVRRETQRVKRSAMDTTPGLCRAFPACFPSVLPWTLQWPANFTNNDTLQALHDVGERITVTRTAGSVICHKEAVWTRIKIITRSTVCIILLGDFWQLRNVSIG